MKLRSHQIEFSNKLVNILNTYNIAYLAGEVRSGKTLTALNAASLYGAKHLLVITKKKAISSIESDYKSFGFNYKITVINYESIHKIDSKGYDLVIYDEAHSLGAFPKPSNRAKLCKKLFYDIPCILMSGTPAVESYSQFYHQFYVSKYSPFKEYKTFYKWASDYVDKKEMHLPTHKVTDYSGARINDIDKVIQPYIIKMTQSDAGFKSMVTEHIINIETPKPLVKLAKRLLKDKAIEGDTGYILGDTPAKLQSKVHQIINGHCIIERFDGTTFNKLFNDYKAIEIKKRFKDKKLCIMYYYQNELEILKRHFDITTDLTIFDTTNKHLALQQSSTEGMNVSKADIIVYYNLGFSGKNYLQSRDRLTVKGRNDNNVYYICEDFGMTKKIYDTVSNKGDFNTKLFKQWQQNL